MHEELTQLTFSLSAMMVYLVVMTTIVVFKSHNRAKSRAHIFSKTTDTGGPEFLSDWWLIFLIFVIFLILTIPSLSHELNKTNAHLAVNWNDRCFQSWNEKKNDLPHHQLVACAMHDTMYCLCNIKKLVDEFGQSKK